MDTHMNPLSNPSSYRLIHSLIRKTHKVVESIYTINQINALADNEEEEVGGWLKKEENLHLDSND